MSEICRECNGEIHFEFGEDPADGRWFHSRIDDGSHNAMPVRTFYDDVRCPVEVGGEIGVAYIGPCLAPCRYVADIGAPGIGQSFECTEGHAVLKIGERLYDPTVTGPFEMDEEDVR